MTRYDSVILSEHHSYNILLVSLLVIVFCLNKGPIMYRYDFLEAMCDFEQCLNTRLITLLVNLSTVDASNKEHPFC